MLYLTKQYNSKPWKALFRRKKRFVWGNLAMHADLRCKDIRILDFKAKSRAQPHFECVSRINYRDLATLIQGWFLPKRACAYSLGRSARTLDTHAQYHSGNKGLREKSERGNRTFSYSYTLSKESENFVANNHGARALVFSNAINSWTPAAIVISNKI
jgi:hypothetical protein